MFLKRWPAEQSSINARSHTWYAHMAGGKAPRQGKQTACSRAGASVIQLGLWRWEASCGMRERKHRKGLPAAASLRGRRLNVSDMSLMALPAKGCARAYNRKLVNKTIRAPGGRQTPQSTRTLMRRLPESGTRGYCSAYGTGAISAVHLRRSSMESPSHTSLPERS